MLRWLVESHPLIKIIKALYEDATSTALQNNPLGEFFRTSVGDRQGCLPSPALFNAPMENITQEPLTNYDSSISINGRPIYNLRFAYDIDVMVASTEEHQDVSTHAERSSRACGMEGSTRKIKGTVNSIIRGAN